MATGHLRERAGKNGGKSYQLIAETERDPVTGKRERRYKTVKGTKKQAEAALRKMITDLENGGITKASAMKVADWMHQWVTNYLPNIEETTRVGYQEKIEGYIIPELGNVQLKALNNVRVQSWINGLKERGLAPKTVRNAYNNLNAALKKAVVLRMIPYNPCEGVELPKLRKPQTNVYDAAGIRSALKAAEGTDFYLFVLLQLSLGLRRGEAAALKWKNIDLTKKTVFICENRVHGQKEVVEKSPKTAAGRRTITFGDDVAAALSEGRLQYYKDRAEFGMAFHDDGFVIRKKNGEPYHPDALTKKWRRFVEKNGLDYIRLHDLRHTNATVLIESGVNAKTVSSRLGHADVYTTINTYVKSTPKMDKDAAQKLDDIIFKDSVPASGQ